MVAADAAYCSACGVALSETCPSCGKAAELRSEACPHCGALPEIRDHLHERKLATILFADITGATGLAESLDMERLQEVMAAFQEAMRDEVEKMGGIVDSFVGDAIMAVFGVPASHDDDPDRALTAARRMFDRLSRLNETIFADAGVEVAMRIGVNTGDVLVDTSAPPDLGRITGDAVNVAARLQEHAAPGAVVVAGRTATTATGFRFRDLGSMELRGRTGPVSAFELGPPIEGVGRSSLFAAPIVGRDHELALLNTLYERVVRESVPHLVTVYGPPGVGKSRLVADFTATLEAALSPPAILRGRSRPYGEVIAYGALAEIIKGEAGILDADSLRLALTKVEKLVQSLQKDLSPDDSRRIVEGLAHTAGVGGRDSALPEMSPRQIRVEIRNAWRWFFSMSTPDRPFVVVIEDIHWADPALLDLLEDVADRIEGPVLFVCPARPRLTDVRPNWGGGRRSFSSILLDPLTPEESRELLGFLTASDGLPGGMRQRVLDRAEGNPFFLEEIIRSLVDAGSVTRTEDGLRALAEVTDVQIPDTVHAVIAARLDLLEADHKRALQCAAVIGRSFWVDLLAPVLGWSAERTEEILDDLEQRDLVVARLGGGPAGRLEYRFRHVLIRDVTYETLSRRDRTSIHRWVADWFARTASDGREELLGLQAHHLTRAYDGIIDGGDPQDTEAIRREAFTSLLGASTQARRRVALGEAKHFAREARRVSVTRIEESSAVEALGEAFFYGYEGDAAWQHLREAVDLRLASEDPEPSDIARLCARALEMPVRWPGAMLSPPPEDTVADYLRIGTANVTDPGSLDAVRLLTVKAFWQHAFTPATDDSEPPLVGPEEALRSAKEAVAAARRLGNPELESAALDGVSACYLPEGGYRESLAASKRRLELIPHLHDLWEIGDTFAMNSWSRYHLGHYREAFRHADEGFRRTIGEAPSLALHCLRYRSQARFRMGEWQEAIEDFRLARRLLADQSHVPPHYVSPVYATAALVHELRREHTEADEILEILARGFEATAPADRDALPLSRWAEFVGPLLGRRRRPEQARELIEATTWRRRGRLGLLIEAAIEVACLTEDWDWAAQQVEEGRALAEERRLDSLHAATEAGAGRVALAEGDIETAIGALQRAVASFAALNAEWDRARTEVPLAQALVADDRASDAAAIIAHALETLERLGDRREVSVAREVRDGL